MTGTQPEIGRQHEILGLRVDEVSKEDLVGALVSWAESDRPRRVHYANVHATNVALRSMAFREALSSADLVFCDGVGLQVGARLLGIDLPERMTPPDWIDEFFSRFHSSDPLRLFLFGDEPNVVDRCGKIISERFDGVVVVGTRGGFIETDIEERALLRDIGESGAALLLIGRGMPLQEVWSAEHAEAMGVPLVITVGALFRWYSGVEPRSPAWMNRLGLEWLGRLARHPVTLFPRYVTGNLRFATRIAKERFLMAGLSRKSEGPTNG